MTIKIHAKASIAGLFFPVFNFTAATFFWQLKVVPFRAKEEKKKKTLLMWWIDNVAML